MAIPVSVDRMLLHGRFVVIPDDLPDTIDMICVGQNEDARLSRSAAIFPLWRSLRRWTSTKVWEPSLSDFI